MPYPTTPNLGLPLVPDGDQAWGQAMRDAMTTIDGAGGGATSSSVIVTCAAATGTVDLGLSFMITGEAASSAGRFRLYRDASGLSADSARASTADAPMSVGLLLDDLFDAGTLAIQALPAPGAPNGSTLCHWRWSGDLGATITLGVTKFL